jgi:hypothetical protein
MQTIELIKETFPVTYFLHTIPLWGFFILMASVGLGVIFSPLLKLMFPESISLGDRITAFLLGSLVATTPFALIALFGPFP